MSKLLKSTTWSIIAMLYLTIPVAIFFTSWIRAPYNVVLVLCIIVGSIGYFMLIFKKSPLFVVSTRYLIITLLISFLFAVLSGAGGFVWQKPDWTKHNVILNDLIHYAWPVYYGPSAYVSDTTLVYYVAYYLPAALWGKVMGWRAGELGLFATNMLGLWIMAQLIAETIHTSWKKYVIFLLLSGADIIGFLLLQPFRHKPIDMLHIETFATGLQFSSIFTQLSWVPQHALVGWISVISLYNAYKHGYLSYALPWLAMLALLWSPFVSLGLVIVFAPFILFSNVKQWLSSVLLGFLPTGVLFLYFKSQLGVLQERAEIYLWKGGNALNALGMMVLFLVLDLFVFFCIFLVLKKHYKSLDRKLILWLFIVLICIAQITYGTANDFVMRVSIPAIALLFLLILAYINYLNTKNAWIRFCVIFIIVCGMCTPFLEIIQSMKPGQYATNEKPDVNMLTAHLRYKVIHQQYMGLSTKLFGRFLGNYKVE